MEVYPNYAAENSIKNQQVVNPIPNNSSLNNSNVEIFNKSKNIEMEINYADGARIDLSQIKIKDVQPSQKQEICQDKVQDNQDNSIKTQFLNKIKQNKKIICIATIIFLVLLILGISLGVSLSKKKHDQQNNDSDENHDIEYFNCNDHPSQCAGVPQSVSNYILNSYTQPDEVRSLFQVSRSLGSIAPPNTTNLTRDQLVSSYRNVTRSVQCMAYNLPNNYGNAFQTLTELQFDNQQTINQYLNMNEAFSGQPLRMTSDASMANTCQFNLTASRRRRLQQTHSQPPLRTNNCSQNYSVLIYFNGIGYSPSAAIQNVKRTQEILSGNSSINFDAGIIAFGAWRKDDIPGFLQNLVIAYRLMLQQAGQTVPDYVDLLSCLRMILNLCNSSSNLPNTITQNDFIRFRNYFVQRSTESFINNQIQYNTNKHAEFVTQQLNEGKKVVLLAHAQGSLYANLVYNLLTSSQKQSVSLVFVAPTASSMADGSTNYLTNPGDIIITALRLAAQTLHVFPAPLPANAQATAFRSDLDFGFNHDLPGYAQAYTQTLTSLLYSAKNRAIQPARIMGSGPITITLTWDQQPDIDLHVFQPNYNSSDTYYYDRSHVYYGQKNGLNGYLDVDDTTSYGPQHYYTNCTIQQGNYTVRVNFYSGYSNSTAIATVSAGSQYYVKSFNLYPPLYSGGNYLPPYFICTIMVSISPTSNEYKFQIIHD